MRLFYPLILVALVVNFAKGQSLTPRLSAPQADVDAEITIDPNCTFDLGAIQNRTAILHGCLQANRRALVFVYGELVRRVGSAPQSRSAVAEIGFASECNPGETVQWKTEVLPMPRPRGLPGGYTGGPAELSLVLMIVDLETYEPTFKSMSAIVRLRGTKQ